VKRGETQKASGRESSAPGLETVSLHSHNETHAARNWSRHYRLRTRALQERTLISQSASMPQILDVDVSLQRSGPFFRSTTSLLRSVVDPAAKRGVHAWQQKVVIPSIPHSDSNAKVAATVTFWQQSDSLPSTPKRSNLSKWSLLHSSMSALSRFSSPAQDPPPGGLCQKVCLWECLNSFARSHKDRSAAELLRVIRGIVVSVQVWR